MHPALSSDMKYIGLAFNYLKMALAQHNTNRIIFFTPETSEYIKKKAL